MGEQALEWNTDGLGNTANGAGALTNLTATDGNTASGAGTLANTQSSYNTASGYLALSENGNRHTKLHFQYRHRRTGFVWKQDGIIQYGHWLSNPRTDDRDKR